MPIALPARAQAAPPLFGTTSRMLPGIGKFPKWQGTLQKYFDERAMEDAPCEAQRRRFGHCHLTEWRAFLASLAGHGADEQIRTVNAYMNKAQYVVDPVNWNVPDYWSTPEEFLRKKGDCEDYAITKFMSLRALGYDQSFMRVVVLQDQNLDLAHAVLALERQTDYLILDNQIAEPVSDTRIRHYKPIYSVNETNWWLHR
ncbi:MAG: transglutaminase-like cysteine peptidase [Alphaproteobacteria bacterium]